MKIDQFLNESQDPKSVEKTLTKLNELLTKGEEIQYVAVQKKPAINFSPDSIALTNKRIILCRLSTFGFSMDFVDYLWKDVKDCHISEGMFGATFYAMHVKGGRIYLDYLPKSQARILYRYAQEKEEEMIEYRRQRELEDSRAKAGGGIYVNSSNEKNNKEVKSNEDPVQVLKKLKGLLEEDLITKKEFETKKSEILSRM